MPAITVDGAQLTVHQQGRPDFHLRGADLHVSADGEAKTLKGTFNDPEWGLLTLEGRFGPEKGKGEIVLRGDRVHVTPERLKSIPLVSPNIWKQVQGQGDTRAEVRFTLNGDEESYQVTLEPLGATIDVASVHLHSTNTIGRWRQKGMVHAHAVNGGKQFLFENPGSHPPKNGKRSAAKGLSGF